MKQVMVRAHEIARDLEGDYRARLKIALTIAWREYKEEENKLTWNKLEKQLEKIVAEKGYTDYYVNNWSKGEHDRSYIELRWYRKGKLKEVKKCGYWDNVKEEYIVESKFQKNYNVFEL